MERKGSRPFVIPSESRDPFDHRRDNDQLHGSEKGSLVATLLGVTGGFGTLFPSLDAQKDAGPPPPGRGHGSARRGPVAEADRGADRDPDPRPARARPV